jgi:hypothetical protein
LKLRLKPVMRSPFAWLPALVCFELIALSVASEDLIPHRSSDDLRVTAPRLHFLTGRSLQRLRDGVSVPFDFQLSIASGVKTNVMQRALERFVVSYDLWEEKFSVVRLRNLRKSSPGLSSNAAESWCLDNIFVPIPLLPPDRDLWARLEIRSADARQGPAFEDPSLSLTSLIEVFSRPARAQQDHWLRESGPFRVADLK